MASNTESDTSNILEGRWLACLDEEIANNFTPEIEIRDEVLDILRELLLSGCTRNQIVDAAQEIDTFFMLNHEDLYPTLRTKDERMKNYLTILYSTIFGVARFLDYTGADSRIVTLAELIYQLHSIPCRTLHIRSKQYLVYRDEPMFGVAMMDQYSRSVDDKDEQAAERGCAESKQRCQEWVNLSTFLAICFERCIYHRSFQFNYPLSTIKDGLEVDNLEITGTPRTYRMMAAAQYLLVAPRIFLYALIKQRGTESGLEQWQLWATRLKDISCKDGISPRLKRSAGEARRSMISVDSTLFTHSEGGTKPDP